MSEPTPEQLQELADRLRAEIREARGTLKDLRYEIKTARELVPLLMDDLFETEVKQRVDELGRVTEKAMDASVDRIFAKFDQLFAVLTADDKSSRRAGSPSLQSLARPTTQQEDLPS